GELADGRCFLAMEYIDGCSLSEWSRVMRKQEGGGDFRLVTHIGIKVAEALQAAHTALDAKGDSLGVVHRDVSPGNVLLSRRGHIKVVDFGIAKSSLRTEDTAESLKGKLRYMSPEQAQGADLDVRTDVYSLALVMWELLVGRRVFSAKRDMALLNEVRAPRIVPPSEHVDGIPPELDAVLLKALSPLAEDRYATSRDFARALRGAVPSASAVEAADIAALVGTIPQRNVDRATMTGTGSGSISLVSRTTPTRESTIDAAPLSGDVPLGVSMDFPIATADLEPDVASPEGARSKRHLLAVAAVAVVLLSGLVMILATKDATAVASPAELIPVVDTENEANVNPTLSPSATDLERTAPQVPQATPQIIPETAPVGLPPRSQWGRNAPGMTGREAPSTMVAAASMRATAPVVVNMVAPIDTEPSATRMETRAGTTLLAGEEDQDSQPRRVTMGTGTRIQGTLLAD
ncbi:MAG: serine/threonine protein kinase, partial [Polyangiales bacterium]